MKKIIFLLTLVVIVSIACAGVSYAASFNSAINYSASGAKAGQTYVSFYDTFTITHDIAFDPPAGSISSAALKITHRGNAASSSELWIINAIGGDDPSSALLGNLLPSNGTWKTQTFILSSDLFDDVTNTASWNISFGLTAQPGNELKLASSMLYGKYLGLAEGAVLEPKKVLPVSGQDPSADPVPEPASLLLFGSGLFGFALKRKK